MPFKSEAQRRAVMAALAAGALGTGAVLAARSSAGRRLMKRVNPARGKRYANIMRKRAGRTRMRDQQRHAAKRAFYRLHGRAPSGKELRFKRPGVKQQKKGGMFKPLPPNPNALPGFKTQRAAELASDRRIGRAVTSQLVHTGQANTGAVEEWLVRQAALKRLARIKGTR